MQYIAQAQVNTPKAQRYLKALCNHFSHKATANYDDNRGTVQFEFGTCEMLVDEQTLSLHVQAADADSFARVKHVVGDHLVRFASSESIEVIWSE